VLKLSPSPTVTTRTLADDPLEVLRNEGAAEDVLAVAFGAVSAGAGAVAAGAVMADAAGRDIPSVCGRGGAGSGAASGIPTAGTGAAMAGAGAIAASPAGIAPVMTVWPIAACM
jgi:hypothetical protein